MRTSRRPFVCLLACLISPFAASALAQPTNTTSESSATEIAAGATPSVYVWTTTYIGPQTIRIGAQTGCVASESLPPAGCTPSGGTGTRSDPFAYSCGAIPLSGCAGGSLLSIVPGGEDIDTFVFSVDPPLPPVEVQAVPLSSWVPVLTAVLVLLCALIFWRRRATRAPSP